MSVPFSPRDRREALHALLRQPDCHFPASVHDPMSMRAARDLEFSLAMLAGSVAAQAVLAAPDLMLLDAGELAALARRLCRATDLPLLVDADHGYGNEWHVARCVEELEASGVAALTLEDTDLPPRPGDSGKSRLLDLSEATRKLQAALAARRDGLLVLGRTSAPIITDLEDAVRRLKAYEDVGVDALCVVGVRDWHELEVLSCQLHLPLMLGGAAPELVADPARLASLGVKVCLRPHLPMAAAVAASYRAMLAQRDGLALEQEYSLDGALMRRLLGAERYLGPRTEG